MGKKNDVTIKARMIAVEIEGDAEAIMPALRGLLGAVLGMALPPPTSLPAPKKRRPLVPKDATVREPEKAK